MLSRWAAVMCLAILLALSLSCEKAERTGAVGTISDASDVRIVYIPKNTGNPYFEPMIDGFRKAAEEHGAKFDTVAPATADATSQIPLIKDQIQRGVHVLALSPNSPDALNQVLREAMSKGIIVLAVDSDLNNNEQFRHAGVLPTDPEEVGRNQIELVGSMIDYKGEIAILSATTDAPNQNTWIKWMREALKDPKYQQMQLVDVVYGNDEPQKSLTEAEALLTKYPNLRGIIAPTTVGIAAAAQVVETAKKADQVKVTGLGTPNQMRRFIKNGTVEKFALWSPYDEGYVAGHLGILLATGQVESTPGTTFSAGELGERTIQEKNVVIAGPPFVFTEENIDEFQF